MKKFIKRLLRFLFYSVVFYILFLLVFGAFVPLRYKKNLNYKVGTIGLMQKRLEELKTVSDVDILFVGSSAAYRGFDTRIFAQSNIKSFNLGSSAQTPIQTLYLLERYLPSIQHDLLIIDVNPLMFTFDGVESALDLISNDELNSDMLKMAFTVNHLKVYNTLLYAFFINLIQKEKPEAIQTWEYDTYIPGGFVESEIIYFHDMDYEPQYWNYYEKQFEAFREIITLLEENQINFWIVQTPMTSKLYNSHLNNDTFDSIMHSYGKYYNFNNVLPMNDSLHFLDANHLNQNGVDLYNPKLIELINSGI
jgi:hypothetical protein